MPVYAIAQGTVVNRAMLDDYVAKAIPTLEKHKGKILAASEDPEVVEGTLVHKRYVLLEFASREAFRRWYDSPEYQATLRLRLESVPGTFVLVGG